MGLSAPNSKCRAPGRKTVLMSFDEASTVIAAHGKPLGIESVSIDTADGRILARPAIANCTAPATLVSAMDGYAVRDSDLSQVPASLRIAGKSFAGAGFDGALPSAACIRIFTGAPAPAGTDRVIPQEDVCEESGAAIFTRSLSQRRHLRLPGSDFRQGDVIVSAGSILNPQRLVGAAASNLGELHVYRQPRVAILCCGDELAEPGSANSPPHTIPESISYGIAALVRRWGGTVVARWRRPDNLACLQSAAADASLMADVVVVIGGASVGEKDLAKDAFAPLGTAFQQSRNQARKAGLVRPGRKDACRWSSRQSHLGVGDGPPVPRPASCRPVGREPRRTPWTGG